MSKFVLGPTKTRDGRDVVIFEISDQIYCKVRNGQGWWYPAYRNVDGQYNGSWHHSPEDLLPNRKPIVVTHEVTADVSNGLLHLPLLFTDLKTGDKIRVTIEEIV